VFTVAVIGPDGAGKSTIARQVMRSGVLPIKYVYMGINLENSNLVLPTTRLILEIKRLLGGRPDMAGPPDPSRRKPSPKNPIKRLFKTLKTSLRMMNVMAEEWFRQSVVWYYMWRGNIVIFDRHFFIDYYAHDIAGGHDIALANRVHGAMLKHLYPRPNLVIMLDAPPEVLYNRKGEGTLELLENRRQEYLQLQAVMPHFRIVDATQPQDHVAQQVSNILLEFYSRRASSPINSEDASIVRD
jgi:thymidylate kinase